MRAIFCLVLGLVVLSSSGLKQVELNTVPLAPVRPPALWWASWRWESAPESLKWRSHGPADLAACPLACAAA